jgi:hypothetical protein
MGIYTGGDMDMDMLVQTVVTPAAECRAYVQACAIVARMIAEEALHS